MNESIKDYGKRLLDGLTTIDQNLVDEVYTEIYQRINSHNTIHFFSSLSLGIFNFWWTYKYKDS